MHSRDCVALDSVLRSNRYGYARHHVSTLKGIHYEHHELSRQHHSVQQDLQAGCFLNVTYAQSYSETSTHMHTANQMTSSLGCTVSHRHRHKKETNIKEEHTVWTRFYWLDFFDLFYELTLRSCFFWGVIRGFETSGITSVRMNWLSVKCNWLLTTSWLPSDTYTTCDMLDN